MLLIVGSLNEKEVYVMTTLTFLGDIQRNEAAVITFAQDVNAYGRILFFFSNLGMFLTGIGNVRPERLSVFSYGR